uniref:Uncharacterized protein n=1 Tax=Lygus hesperus TaxID=30085 RepID=A0A0A9XUD9_LYGHE
MLGLHQVIVRGRVGVKYCSFTIPYTSRYYSKGPLPEDCKKKPVQSLGETPALQPKCPKIPEEVCQQGMTSPKRVEREIIDWTRFLSEVVYGVVLTVFYILKEILELVIPPKQKSLQGEHVLMQQ